MSTNSSIEWTDATWNPTVGCTRASAGCDNCYAVTMTHRLEQMGKPKYAGLTVLNPRGERHFNGKVRTVPEALELPLKWKKPRRVFVNSMSDLFHKDVPFDFIDRVFAVMALCPQHTFQVLTKRPERMAEYFNAKVPLSTREVLVAEMHPQKINGKLFTWGNPMHPHQRGAATDPYDRRPWPGWPLPNVWLGASIENQDETKRIPHLLRCPAVVRFLSVEPQIGPVRPQLRMDAAGRDVTGLPGLQDESDSQIHWVIQGGESGPGARPFDIEWARSLRDRCKDEGVAYFLKQLGAFPAIEQDVGSGKGGCHVPVKLRDRKGGDPAEWPDDLRVREMPGARA